MGSYGFTESMLDQHRAQRARRVAKADGHESRPLEKDIQGAILELLETHPKVALSWRQNTGGMYDKRGQFVRFGFPGSPDIHGVLKGGRALFIEVKRPGEKATPEQLGFIVNAQRAGALAQIAYSVDDVLALLRLA